MIEARAVRRKREKTAFKTVKHRYPVSRKTVTNSYDGVAVIQSDGRWICADRSGKTLINKSTHETEQSAEAEARRRMGQREEVDDE